MSASAIYHGWVSHRRHTPQPHAFRYRMMQLWLDLDELDDVFRDRWLWSTRRRNVAEFRRSDYMDPHSLPLAEVVRDRVEQALGHRPAGPVRLLTHLRYAGYVFNPVSFYYCYAADGETVDSIVAEITNMPWRERHHYVLPVAHAQIQDRTWHWSFDKQFHVSPFLPMDCSYDWRFTAPGEDLRVHMQVWRDSVRQFDATLALRRRPLDGPGLAMALARFPLMTLQVTGAIHWQALRLWLKRNPVHDHPSLSGKQA
jgi:uncharacterized protein